MKYFTMAELVQSAVARTLHIDNRPGKTEQLNLVALVTNILDPVREKLGEPIYVSSAYRSPRLNRAVGGVADSQHMKGEAADVYTKSVDGNKRLYDLMLNMPFDQLIWERGDDKAPAWVHVSYCRDRKNRGEVLRL